MDFLTIDGPGEFQFPCELLLGRNPLLHPEDEFDRHNREVKQAKADCIEWNKQFLPKPKTQNKTK